MNTKIKTHIISDLHVDHREYNVKPPKVDLLIIAGDVSNSLNGFTTVKRLAKESECELCVYVPGNHEFYEAPVENWWIEAKTSFDGTNIKVLDNDIIVFRDIIIAGSILWSDCSHPRIPKKEYDAIVERSISDFDRIRTFGMLIDVPEMRSRFLDAVKFLAGFVSRKAFKKARKRVVVTHFSPAHKLIPARYRNMRLNYYYHGSLDSFVEMSGIDYWFYGHTHAPHQDTIGITKCICNPRGYPREANAGFNTQLIVWI